MRVISLISSATEIVYRLGCGKKMVGRSHECDYPPEVLNLPFCTKPKFNIDGRSKEIDDRVKSLLQQALSIYYVDEKKLIHLEPDLIITQTQCEVCAVSLKDVEHALKEISQSKPRVISVEPNNLDDIWQSIDTISQALEVKHSGDNLIEKMKTRLHELNFLVKKLSPRRVACIEWIDPLMAAGNWVPELVNKAGGINLFGKSGKHSPWLDPKDLFYQDPEIIIIMPCGYDIKKSIRDIKPLFKIKGWEKIRAVKEGQVYIVDGNQYFNRPGPRLTDSLEILIEIIHQNQISFGHEGRGWIKYYN